MRQATYAVGAFRVHGVVGLVGTAGPQEPEIVYWYSMNVSFSQGLQDLRLHRIFRALSITTGTFVECGFPAVQTSNTEVLKRSGWTGVRFDGACLGKEAADSDAQCVKAWVASANIVELFRKHGVGGPPNPTYVSIDLDTIDIWVLRALLAGGIRPTVLTVEYNSNYPLEYALAFPDTSHTRDDGQPPARETRRWDGDCYMGSSAGALIAVAREFGFVVVDVEPGLDLFLVDGAAWGARPVPTLHTSSIFRPFNLRRNRTGLAGTRKARQMLDYNVWRSGGGSTRAARKAAAQAFTTLAARPELPCFSNHRCADSELVLCADLWSVLCKPSAQERNGGSSWFANPCHGARGLWHMGYGLTLRASRKGAAARRFLARDLNVRAAF